MWWLLLIPVCVLAVLAWCALAYKEEEIDEHTMIDDELAKSLKEWEEERKRFREM
jgi:hypothetical protein